MGFFLIRKMFHEKHFWKKHKDRILSLSQAENLKMFFFDRMFHEKLFAFFYLNKIFFVVCKISKSLVFLMKNIGENSG